MECPRCDGVLRDSVLDPPIYTCPDCAGLLLGRRALSGLFEDLSVGIPAQAEPPPAVADVGGELFCPACAVGMHNYGYLGASRVMVDRCSGCDLLWVDGGELETLRVQWARSEAGSKRRVQKLEAVIQMARTTVVANSQDFRVRATRARSPLGVFAPDSDDS